MAGAQPPPCRVCRQRPAEYTCPRCNARYCSLDCYKQHSERCTEGFYKDAAVAELHSIRAGEAEKAHMMEILQRLHQQELGGSSDEEGGEGGSDRGGSDEEGEGLSAETLHRLLAKMQAAGGDAEVSAEDLSPAELAAFHRALAAGELSDTLAPWQPWWLTEEAAALELGVGGTPLVVAAEEQASAAADGEQQRRQQALLPVPPSRPLPPLATLTRAAPSPVLRGQLLDLLYSYCLTLRRYNGDWEWEAADAADTLFALSAVLTAAAGGGAEDGSTTASGDEAGGDAASVLLACVQRACRPPVGGAELRGFAVSVLSDVAAMLRLGRAVVLTALMDTSRLVEAARQQLEGGGEGGRSKQCKELRRRLVAAERKLLFLLSWANELPAEGYDRLAAAAEAEHRRHAAAGGHGGGRQPPSSTHAGGAASKMAAAAAAGAIGAVEGGWPPGKARVLVEELA
ncbi:zinc finger HIT domain-containing 2 isoform A [Micractinium conductrix]|uniref:Zinc finger HIT domain-containing 2 isoform A n=1 Tax=Micractinium conductrix TaxID=554055 RepID=A0A2P6VDZ5_9CHLO|nr:zinc finger HIT domain-containing 2 isoform A [Micractinium conductrix]|eukprot:PSC72297.1 zinc finger HIT domain-containing 2 isoform A [Micractinium conductrix]